MVRQLSSRQTFFGKFIFAPAWIGGFGFEVLRSYSGAGAPKANLTILLFWIAGSAFIYWSCIRLKKVSVDDHYLYVSNYLKEISVPLSHITAVTEHRWINSHPVTVYFQFSTEFGDRIVFMPKTRWFAFFSSHPVVGELRRLAELET